MTEKEQIRAEIERLYNSETPKHDQQCGFDDGYFTGLSVISNFLDSLPEEKPSEELEEAAEEWAENEAYGKSDAEFEMAYKGFIAGAEQQKAKMMKDAVEGEVIYDLGGFFRIKSEAIDGAKYKVGSWVKLIIVKED